MKFTLDSSVLVDAVRAPDARIAAEMFLRWARERVYLSAVVVAELESGATSDAAREWLDEHFLAPFDRRGRIVAPTASMWRTTGRLMSRSGERSPIAAWQNDTLLAVQSREEGWIVVTRDRDFERLRGVVKGLQVATPFPAFPVP